MRKIPVIAALGLLLLAAAPTLAVQTTGKVIDCGDEGMPLVQVEFTRPEADSEVAGTAWTDDYGTFSLNVPSGSYTVQVSDGEEDSPRVSTPVTIDDAGTMTPPTVRGEDC